MIGTSSCAKKTQKNTALSFLTTNARLFKTLSNNKDNQMK